MNMKNKTFILFPTLVVILFFQSLISAQEMQHQHPQAIQERPALPLESEKPQATMTLHELEQIALQNNPTLGQAAATVRATEGRKLQSMLYPNPIFSVETQDISLEDTGGQTDEHLYFNLEQKILLGGKRGKAGNFFEQQKQLAETNADMQKLRVLNSVRLLYYQVLGIQKQLQVRDQLQKVAEEAVEITKELFNVGSADQPDLLEAEIEAQSAQLASLAAQNERIRLWKQLTSAIGNPELPLATLAGSLETNPPLLNQDELLRTLLNESLQVKTAQLQLVTRQAAIPLAKSEAVPDLRLLGGIGYNYETLQPTGKHAGFEATFVVGIPLPLFNRNQGQVAVATAEAQSAEREIKRVQLALAAKFSSVYTEYLNAKTIAERYRNEMLPRAKQAYELYMNSFQKMQAAYPQVLIAQRNQYQLEVDYVEALTNQWTAALQIEGSLLTEGALSTPLFAVSEDR
jgi:outer membrane protein, heavy metal efflux system